MRFAKTATALRSFAFALEHAALHKGGEEKVRLSAKATEQQ
jgi:hypothetical protein